MKVTGSGPVQGSGKVGKKKSVSETGEAFGAFVADQAQESAATTTTQSIAQVDALLAVQGTEDPTEREAKQRARQRANTILDELDKIRIAMLNGTLTVGHMVDIADVVASHRENVQDSAMTAIMDEIDVRAQVELAKMRFALGTVREDGAA